MLLFTFTQPILTKAASPIQYNNEVNISIHLSTTVKLTLNGSYQLNNKDTGNVTAIPTGTVLNVAKDSNGVTVTFGTFRESSISGFNIEELVGTGTSFVQVNTGNKYRGSLFLKPNGNQVQLINYLDMEDYLKGVVPNEMPASWPKEALKAQAIAARSYAAHVMMLTTTAASQVYKGYSGEDPRTNVAVEETSGVYVKYNGKPIQTFFFSTSGGRTANVGDVWNSNQSYFPYLVSVDDPYESSPYSNWSVTYTSAELLKMFGVSDTTAKINDLALLKSGANGEVRGATLKTSVGDIVKTGNESQIRDLFPLASTSLYNKLYSNWFDVELTKENTEKVTVQTANGQVSLDSLQGQVVQTVAGQVTLPENNVSIQTSNGMVPSGDNQNGTVTSVTLNGKGWGHRIGMSQYGAKGFAEKGWTAEQILTHYFQGTTVSK